jgi:hypothetical protein
VRAVLREAGPLLPLAPIIILGPQFRNRAPPPTPHRALDRARRRPALPFLVAFTSKLQAHFAAGRLVAARSLSNRASGYAASHARSYGALRGETGDYSACLAREPAAQFSIFISRMIGRN